jgi:hypothetical protein
MNLFILSTSASSAGTLHESNKGRFLMAIKKEAKTINKGGRPRKEIDRDMLTAIAHLQPTIEEIASALKISVNTFKSRLDETPELKEILDQAKNTGKLSLRRMMWKNATSGNTTMQIWLSKQYLDMRDKQVVEQTIDFSKVNLSSLSDEQLDRLIEDNVNG